jgi:uncharacterized RDD family membrane protein YckC
MSLKDFFKQIDWKNPNWENYKQAFLKPRPIDIFPFFGKRKMENGYVLAGFSGRTFAMTLDMLLVLMIFSEPLRWVSEFFFPEVVQEETHQRVMQMLVMLEDAAITPVYFVQQLAQIGVFHKMAFDLFLQIAVAGILTIWSLHRWQATPGMWLLRMKVISAEDYGKVPLDRLIKRYLVLIPALLILTIGYVWINFSKRRQGWHDKAAGTLVIQQPFSSWWRKDKIEIKNNTI